MHCADCGAWLDPDLDFCQSCGLEASGHQECPNCGEELREDPEACTICNWEIGDDLGEVATEVSEPWETVNPVPSYRPPLRPAPALKPERETAETVEKWKLGDNVGVIILGLVILFIVFAITFSACEKVFVDCPEKANGTLDCSYQDLSGTDLRNADLSEADLSGVNLSGAKLDGADLSGTDLRNVDLSGVDLRNVDLSGVDLSGADLRNARLASSLGTSGADLSGADLSGTDLSGTDLRDVDLSGADLRDADLSGAVLSSSFLKDGADLSGADLSGADLSGADLSSSFVTPVDLSGAKLWRADLSGADLSGADLSNADLSAAKADEDTTWPEGFDPESAGVIEPVPTTTTVTDFQGLDSMACLSVRGNPTGMTNAGLRCFVRVPSQEFSFPRNGARWIFGDEDLLSSTEMDLGAQNVGLIFIRRAVQLHCCGASFDIDDFTIEITNSGHLPAHYFMTVRFLLWTTNWAGNDPHADVHYCTATAIGPGATEIVTFRRMDRPTTAVIEVQGYDAAVDGETYSITPAEMVRAWTQYMLDDSAHWNLAGWAEGVAAHGVGMAFQNFDAYLKEIHKIYLPEGRDRDPCSRTLGSRLHHPYDYNGPRRAFAAWMAEADGMTFSSP